MKKLLLLISIISLAFSCKEANVGGFTAQSVKADIIENLKGTVWLATNDKAFYEKIEMDGEMLVGTKNGQLIALPFEVSNIDGLMEELPASFELRINAGNLNEEIYLSNNYSNLMHSVRLNSEYPQKLFSHYTKQ